jgi:hypothetical protein
MELPADIWTKMVLPRVARDDQWTLGLCCKELVAAADALARAEGRPERRIGMTGVAGSVELLIWARGAGCPWHSKIHVAAARGGNLEVLKWLHAQDPPCPGYDGISVLNAAAGGGHLEALQWLHARYTDEHEPDEYDQRLAYTTMLRGAAEGGRIPVMQWLLQQPLAEMFMRSQSGARASIVYKAARNGRLQMVQWLSEQDLPWSNHVVRIFVTEGNLEALQWLRARDCPGLDFNEDMCYTAAVNGRLEVLQWLRALDPPCPWDMMTCRAAAASNHTALLLWARQQGCPE